MSTVAGMDPRVRARRIAVARSEGRRRFRRLLALGTATVLVAALILASRSPLLDVDHVAVAGAAHSGDAQVRARAAIASGRAMTSVDLDAAATRVEALPWVGTAQVTRRWPGTVRVSVTERTPVGVAGRGAGAVVVDRDGRILGAATAADAELPLVGPDPVAGPGGWIPEHRRPVAALLADLPSSIRPSVAEATIDDRGLVVILDTGIRVHLGDRSRLRAKTEAIGVLLADADAATIATIDVAVPGAPALTRRAVPLTTDEVGGA